MALSVPQQIARGWQSLITKMALIILTLLLVPVIVYHLLDRADQQRSALILRTIQEEGRLITEALLPRLREFTPEVAESLGGYLPRLAAGGTRIKILFRPNDADRPESFYFVASHPKLTEGQVNVERRLLVASEVLSLMKNSCGVRKSMALNFINTQRGAEVLTYIGSQVAEDGCWVILTSLHDPTLVGVGPDRSYWEVQEFRGALAIYVIMVILVMSIYVGTWRSLRRFAKVAKTIRRGAQPGVTFREQNRIPELDGVAVDFDTFVHTLKRSERLIRQAAEENAHALKAPLAVLSQSLEPIKKTLQDKDKDARRGLLLVEHSVGRLDALISAARRIDEATAELMSVSRTAINLSELLSLLAKEYDSIAASRNVRIRTLVEDGLRIVGNDNLIETALENVIENALSFAPAGSVVVVSAVADGDDITVFVDDEGPGIRDDMQERVFARNFSTREGDGVEGNYGIGLWVVRRNIEVFGGSVSASTHPSGGCRIEIHLPALRLNEKTEEG